MGKQFAYEKMMEGFRKRDFIDTPPKRILDSIKECEKFYKNPYQSLDEMKPDELDTLLIAGIKSGAERKVLAEIFEYYKERGIRINSQDIGIFAQQIKLNTNQLHAESLSTLLESPELNKRGTFIVENENPWLGGARPESKINYSEGALNEYGGRILGMLVHPDKVAEYTAVLARQCQGKSLSDFEAYLEQKLKYIQTDKLYTEKPYPEKEKIALLQAILRNLRDKRNEYQIAKEINPERKLGSLAVNRPAEVKSRESVQNSDLQI